MNTAGVPAIVELTLMPVSAQWLPVADCQEQQLVDRLVRDGRAFVKGVRVNLGPVRVSGVVALMDFGFEPATPSSKSDTAA